jgi:hypothetical protein
MTTETKTKLAGQIAQCVIVAAEHFQTTPEAVMSKTNKGGKPATWTRQAVWHYLIGRGMNPAQIGRIWGREAPAIAYGAKQGGMMLMLDDRAMLETLPKIKVRKHGK